MATSFRREVLQSFKNLHRTRKMVLMDDEVALGAARLRINEEFKKNKHVKDVTAIAELVQYAKAVQNELLTTVVQAKEVEPGVYEARFLPETVKLDNTPYKP